MTIKIMGILGYQGNDKGLCHGIAVSAAISYCLGSNGEFFSMIQLMRDKIQNINPKVLCNVLQRTADLKNTLPFKNKCVFDEICKYLEEQKNEDSKSFVKSAMKNNEDSEPDVKFAIEKINRKAMGDFSEFKETFTKKELFRIKTTLDNICMFMGKSALPEDFFKAAGMPYSQIKNMDHTSMLMGYHTHEIKASIEALFNKKDLKFVIRNLIKATVKRSLLWSLCFLIIQFVWGGMERNWDQ